MGLLNRRYRQRGYGSQTLTLSPERMTIVAVELRDWITPGLMCAALYFVMSFPLARWARRIERRLEPIQAPVDEAAT